MAPKPPTERDQPTDADAPTRRDRARRAIRTLGVAAVTGSVALVGTVSAQTQVGDGVCGSPFATTLNQGAPLAVGILMAAAAVLAYLLHTYSGMKRDPQAVQEVKEWRNRSAAAVITTPIFAWALIQFLGFTGVGIADCIQLSPF